MAAQNQFIDPPPQTHPGVYTFAASLQYGSPQEFSWTSNYSIPLDLVLVQETAFLADNTLPPHFDTIACTVPLLPLPVNLKGGS